MIIYFVNEIQELIPCYPNEMISNAKNKDISGKTLD